MQLAPMILSSKNNSLKSIKALLAYLCNQVPNKQTSPLSATAVYRSVKCPASALVAMVNWMSLLHEHSPQCICTCWPHQGGFYRTVPAWNSIIGIWIHYNPKGVLAHGIWLLKPQMSKCCDVKVIHIIQKQTHKLNWISHHGVFVKYTV